MDSTFKILAGGKLTVNASGQEVELDVSKPFTNNGQIELTSGVSPNASILNVSGTLTNASGATIGAYGGAGGDRRIEPELNNQAGGTVYVEADSYMRLYKGNVTHVNAGTIDIANRGTPGTGNETLYSFGVDDSEIGAAFTNSGTINVGSNRTMYIGASDALTNTSTGVIAGKGTIDATASLATFTNAGTIEPGGVGVVGVMRYKGSFNIGTGTIRIDMASMVSGDQLQVTGSAAIGNTGKFSVNDIAVFTHTSGTLSILTATTSTGTPVVIPSAFPGGWFVTNIGVGVNMFANLGAPPPGGPPQ